MGDMKSEAQWASYSVAAPPGTNERLRDPPQQPQSQLPFVQQSNQLPFAQAQAQQSQLPVEQHDGDDDWKEFETSDGRKYYHRRSTGETKWKWKEWTQADTGRI